MNTYKINIETPCTEDWKKMTQVEKGRHCSTCNKAVIDFSNMKDQDIIQYLLKNKNSCGRFQKNQLARPILLLKNTRKTSWPAIAAMLVAGLFSVMPQSVKAATIDQSKIYTSILNIPIGGEKTTNKVEPTKTGTYSFSIQIFTVVGKDKIQNGTAYIENVGTFLAAANGNIIIEIKKEDIPEMINITVGAPGYEYLYYKIYKKNLKGFRTAQLYLYEMEMLVGTISVDMIPVDKK